jgi:class 3 adenylate cyclase
MDESGAIEDIEVEEFLEVEELSPAEFRELGVEEILVGRYGSEEAPPGPGAAAADPESIEQVEEEGELKSRIATYYLNKQLEESLLAYGAIPDAPAETVIGIGFIDIVDYSYLSSWLSPRENQAFLNGLYTAFHLVLKRSGGYLNKISGDSMMFHFGGTIDPAVRALESEAAQSAIAASLFRTCVAIQESCRLFNRADESFIPADADRTAKRAMSQAFAIMRALRENLSVVSSVYAMFQVRIRIGASLGEVCIGNFGPEGARQWDVIGNSVIEARRMESTAPVDGIRISWKLYERLAADGVPPRYLGEFRAKASGFYQGIEEDELFRAASVVLKDKREASFASCAVQANPDLPEDVWRLVESSLEKKEGGVEAILDLLRYYRGNRLVVGAVEELFREREIELRKADIFARLLPGRFASLLAARSGDESALRAEIEAKVDLFKVFTILGRSQDRLKRSLAEAEPVSGFESYEERMADIWERSQAAYRAHRLRREQESYFHEVLFPYCFSSIETSLLEYRARRPDLG